MKFSSESENSPKIGGKSETGGEMHHGLRGGWDGRPCLQVPCSMALYKTHYCQLLITRSTFNFENYWNIEKKY